MPELRFDLALGGYSIIASHRAKRPKDFKDAQKDHSKEVEFEPKCPFCPGNEEMTPPMTSVVWQGDGEKEAWSVRVVPNKFPALKDPAELGEDLLPPALTTLSLSPHEDVSSMYWRAPALGGHEVVVESPLHNGTLGNYTQEHMATILEVLKERMESLAERPGVKYVHVFRNYGKAAGASLAHPHFQIMALPLKPPLIASEEQRFKEYEEKNKRCVMCDLIEREIEKDLRVISCDESYAVIAPFASRFSYESIIVPRRHQQSFLGVSETQLKDLAKTIVNLFSRYEALFASLPYNIVLHSPNGGGESSYHWHIHIYPRLNTEAGLEMGTGVHINPTPPESARDDLKSAL